MLWQIMGESSGITLGTCSADSPGKALDRYARTTGKANTWAEWCLIIGVDPGYRVEDGFRIFV